MKWINCKDGCNLPSLLPGDNDISIDVLVSVVDEFDGERKVTTARHSLEDEAWYDVDGEALEFCQVTHWMPLPPAPEED